MTQLTRDQQVAALEKDWAANPRWKGIKRGYSAEDVVRLRGSLVVEQTLAPEFVRYLKTQPLTASVEVAAGDGKAVVMPMAGGGPQTA
jgi:isocitrate lyase